MEITKPNMSIVWVHMQTETKIKPQVMMTIRRMIHQNKLNMNEDKHAHHSVFQTSDDIKRCLHETI